MRLYLERAAAQDPDPAAIDAFAGTLSGLFAGAAYLVAQISFAATVRGGQGWEPLQRIAAILLGPDAAPPPAEISLAIAGMALLIHFPLAAVYGRIADLLVRGRTLGRAALLGGLLGLAIFGLNFWLIAPSAFPWFEQSRDLVTAFDHVLFGAAAGLACAFLRRRPRGR